MTYDFHLLNIIIIVTAWEENHDSGRMLLQRTRETVVRLLC